MKDIVERLRMDTTEPVRTDVVKVVPASAVALEAADEIERLRVGGCARDQTTTQYCAIAVDAEMMMKRLRNVVLDEAAMVAHRISASARSFGGEETAEMIEREIRALKDGGEFKPVDASPAPLPPDGKSQQ